jgi:uracil-DNA glycosylase
MNAELIEAEHDRLGYSAGWRFMMTAERTLATADVAIVGLNPGGTRRHGPPWSQKEGNAYFIEAWGGKRAGADPLQRQVQRMCQVLGVRQDAVFAAQFVPFRSNAWSDLTRKPEAVAFSRRLWSWALPQMKAKLFVCVGKGVVAPEIAGLLDARPIGAVPAGWGEQTIERYRTADGRLVLGLPHLSRFGLFGRAVSEAAFRTALK